MSILLADDDVQLATFLSKSLESEGYSVRAALDEFAVLAELQRQSYELIILDLNFGQTDGLQLLEKLRLGGMETPVMVLSARNRVADRVQSLNLGADDYLTKPFSFQELAARANAILRRKADPSLSVLRVEDLKLDPATRKARRGKREIKLSPKEFGLLHLLMSHAGETVSRRTLLQETWGTEETDSNLVDVYVNYLRKKVDLASAEKLIQTVRGAGYRLGKSAPPGKVAGEHPASARHWLARKKKAPGGHDRRAAAPQPAARALIHSLSHDLAQPLTSVRCFLEMLARPGEHAPPQAAELKNMEQQADRAIALSKGISAMALAPPSPSAPWIPVETLLSEALDAFATVINSGLLTVERGGEATARVSSNPGLLQLLIFLLSKLIGRNARPLALKLEVKVQGDGCDLALSWRSAGPSSPAAADAVTVLAKDLTNVREYACLIGGEISLQEGQPQISLRLPAAPLANVAKAAR